MFRSLSTVTCLLVLMVLAPRLIAADVSPGSTNAPSPASAAESATASEGQTNAQPASVAPPKSGESTPKSDRETSGRSSRSERRRDRSDRNASATTSDAPPASGNGTDYPSFQVIPERNIFNVNRSSRASRTTREAESKPVKVDTLALVGSMSYPKGDFAFFDGSSSDFRRVLKAGDTIAGFQLRSIGRNSVQLESAGKTVELAIGSHLRREEEGEWKVMAESAPASSSSGYSRRSRSNGEESGSPSSTSTAQASESSGGSADDILQRLMKKRETEMK